jgi:hypothetical protein
LEAEAELAVELELAEIGRTAPTEPLEEVGRVDREFEGAEIDELDELLLVKLIGPTSLRGLEELAERELLGRDELEGGVVTEV